MRRHIVDWLASWTGPGAAAILAPTWFTFAGLAGLVASVMVIRAARRHGDDVAAVVRALLAGYVAAILGGILIPLVADMVMHLLRSGSLRVRWAGMVSYCGFLSGLVAAYLVLRRCGTLSLARFGDLMAAPLGIVVAIARTGCFAAGCDYGQVSAAPWAVRFPAGSPAWSAHLDAGLVAATRDASLPVHPTQLYEALAGVLIFASARWLARLPWARRGQGRVFLAAALIYGAGRLVIEMFRGDASRGFVGALSTGQIFALLLSLAAAAALWRVRRAHAAVLAAALVLLVASPAPRAHAGGGEAPPAQEAAASGPRYQVAVLLGTAVPLNRRSGQVPQLSGGSLSGSLELAPGIEVGIDLDSMASDVATHGSLGVFGGLRRAIHPRLGVGIRGGIGGTVVDFADASFRDVSTVNLRVDAAAEWAFSEQWRMLVRPLSIDFLTAAPLGGPIVTYQFRIGVAYRFGGGRG